MAFKEVEVAEEFAGTARWKSLRLIVLDTTICGRAHSDEQVDSLTSFASTPTIIAIICVLLSSV
jgi:hypothetical protein